MREHDEADGSGSTAEFRAFVDRSGGPEATQAWSMPRRRNRTAMIAAVVIGAVVVLAILLALVFH